MVLFGSLFSKEKKKPHNNFFTKISKVIIGKSTVDATILDDLEEILITSDVGVDTTVKIISLIENRIAKDKYLGVDELNNILREEIIFLLSESNSESKKDFYLDIEKKPYILLVVGVNGVGKTTTIGKLASQFKKQGKKVMLGAADTFRAAAVNQLKIWGKQVGVPVISSETNTDPASVVHDAVKQAIKQEADILIIDTAGRLHTKVNLMNELSKIRHVIQKIIKDAPHEVMLVLDGSTGQNAINQALGFTKATKVNSLVINKLDGTAKGGVVIGISDIFKIPIKYIGTGESVDDIQIFNKTEFVNSLFNSH